MKKPERTDLPVDTRDRPAPKQPSTYSLAVLNGLQGKHVYAGTVPAHVKARRRAANKVARRSRRANRGQR